MKNLRQVLIVTCLLFASCAPQRDDSSFFVLQTEDAIHTAREKSKRAEQLRNQTEGRLNEIESVVTKLRGHAEQIEKTGRSCTASLKYRIHK